MHGGVGHQCKILEDSVHLTTPARDIEYVSALAFRSAEVKPDRSEATSCQTIDPPIMTSCFRRVVSFRELLQTT